MNPDALKLRFFSALPRYRYLETLGRGGVGVVYKALDLELDEVVAIKVLSPDFERDEEALLSRFKREIGYNRKIKHPNVARMYDYGISGSLPYITMEFIPGRDLWTIIHEEKRIPPEKTVPILRQICLGVDAIHRIGILHRDLKSQNIVVDENGAVAILDFGLARGMASEGFTQHSIILGTPQYMAPEQAAGRDVDARTDVYSVGIIAFEALTGRLPFTGDSPIAVAMKQMTEPVPDTLSKFPDVSAGLKAIILKTLEKDPARRFQTAASLESELAALERPAPLRPSAAEEAHALAGGAGSFMADLEKALNEIVVEPVVPAAPQPEPQPAEAPGGPALAPASSGARRRAAPIALLVTADGSEAGRWAGALEREGCVTRLAHGGQEALEHLVKEPADLVVMDVAIPGVDGFDVTRILRSLPALASLPVLLMTTRPDRSQLAFAVQSGAQDLLGIPVEPRALVDRAWLALSHHGFSRPGGGNGSVTVPRDGAPGGRK